MKKSVKGFLILMSMLFGSAALADGAASGPITLLYTGHFMYLPTPVSLMVKIDDPIHNVPSQEFYDTCNGTAVITLMDDATSAAHPNAALYYSHLQASYATAGEVTVDYVVDTDYLGLSITACVIAGVYDGSF